MMQYLSLLYSCISNSLLTPLEPVSFSLILYVIFIKFISLDLCGPAIYRQNYLKLSVQINLFIFQYSHGDYNVGPIMLFC